MKYTKSDISQWILGAFSVVGTKGVEFQFPCPVCEHGSCYFNVIKQIGYCHRASCQTAFTTDTLIDHVGYPPELGGYTPMLEDHVPMFVQLQEVKLPKDVRPILKDDPIIFALASRGVTWKMVLKFKIQQTDKRVYVPVYDEGKLVQYNSRRIKRGVYPPEDWFKKAGPKPYKYAPGRPITNYFLGWQECRMWDELVLVENTFVSMWLRDLNCTTNFGSHLSDVHMDKIVHSRINHVTFLWDEGADAQKAQRKLKKLGVPSTVIEIKGQPDDYNKDTIKEMLSGRV